MSDIIVVGGGAAGMMAAFAASGQGADVLLLERNEKLGKKIYITGKGRCNVTNACDTEDLFSQVVSNRKFLYSAFYTFDNFQVMNFFEEHGIRLETERGNRVFPKSGHASDIIRGLERALQENKVNIQLNAKVTDIACENGGFLVITSTHRQYSAARLILATGGMSYPSTGSTGDGYGFVKKLGHTVTHLSPGLVAMTAKESYIPRLQGLSLRNVRTQIRTKDNQVLYDEFGELLFTHFGVSGPLLLSASSLVGEKLQDGELCLEIDLKPALSEEQLDKRILRDFGQNRRKQFKNSLHQLLPAKLVPVVVDLSGIDGEKRNCDITREERGRLLALLKHFPATLTGLRDFNEAIITRGGISVREVAASTMESRIVPGLYLAGELLDVDALTGGFNLQIAWSSGYLAGLHAAM